MILENTFQSLTAEIYLIISISILLLYGVINSTSLITNRLIIIRNISILSIYILIISILLIYNNPFINIITFNNTFIVDNFINIIKIIVLLCSI